MAVRRKASGDEGAALIELGIMLPVLFGIFLGIVTAGLAFFARLQVTTAAQEGARVLYTGGTADQAQAAAAAATTGTTEVRVNGSVVGGSWKCPSTGGPYVVEVRTSRAGMSINFIAASVPVDVQGRGVTRCA